MNISLTGLKTPGPQPTAINALPYQQPSTMATTVDIAGQAESCLSHSKLSDQESSIENAALATEHTSKILNENQCVKDYQKNTTTSAPTTVGEATIKAMSSSEKDSGATTPQNVQVDGKMDQKHMGVTEASTTEDTASDMESDEPPPQRCVLPRRVPVIVGTDAWMVVIRRRQKERDRREALERARLESTVAEGKGKKGQTTRSEKKDL
ncbi:hypothetical protein QBC41DRAFT_301679 [Cercophora samala]|uniref:Uncharacterized protein n=1 Tax=Cercophora samala TaxID=330535 RepID=A0AA39ZFW5_9PEZI|nr:hypothetical protein QBC41DRAFT_301679 [Cercophora samala]